MRHNLTLNLGLRYEMTTVLSEVQGKLTNLRSMTDPLPYCGTMDPSLTLVFGKPGCTGAAPYYSNPTTRNFEPRFGFAWDPRGDGKIVHPTKTSAGYLWPYNPPNAAGQTKDLRVNPNFGGIRFMSFGTNASYEALQLNVQKRMSHGFQFGGSYTYSKAMDNSSATIAGDAFSNSVTSWFWFAPDISHAPSDFDVRHSSAINGIWQAPVSPSLHGPAATVLRGWELGGILKMNSGIPTTPLIGGDPLGVRNSGSDAFSIPDRVPGRDPVNHDFKSNPGGVFLGYINPKAFTLPKATPEIASQCVPFGFSASASSPNPGIPGTCSNLLG